MKNLFGSVLRCGTIVALATPMFASSEMNSEQGKPASCPLLEPQGKALTLPEFKGLEVLDCSELFSPDKKELKVPSREELFSLNEKKAFFIVGFEEKVLSSSDPKKGLPSSGYKSVAYEGIDLEFCEITVPDLPDAMKRKSLLCYSLGQLFLEHALPAEDDPIPPGLKKNNCEFYYTITCMVGVETYYSLNHSRNSFKINHEKSWRNQLKRSFSGSTVFIPKWR